MKKCKEYYDYVMKQFDRVPLNNVSIHGDMPKRCLAYFERRGIKVRREPLGYLNFLREK